MAEAQRRLRTPGAGCCGGLRGVVAAAILVGCMADRLFEEGEGGGKYFLFVAARAAAGALQNLKNFGQAIFECWLQA